jgi:hypothetical protein
METLLEAQGRTSMQLEQAIHLLETLANRQEVTETQVAKIDERTQRLTVISPISWRICNPHSAVSDNTFLIIIYCIFYSFYSDTNSAEERKNGRELHKAHHLDRALHVFNAKNQHSAGDLQYS